MLHVLILYLFLGSVSCDLRSKKEDEPLRKLSDQQTQDAEYQQKIRNGGKGFTSEEQSRFDSEVELGLIETIEQGDPNKISLLFEAGHFSKTPLDPNMRMRNGGTLLTIAIKSGKLEAARTLLKHGADPRLKDTQGKSAVDLAKEMKREDMLLTLSKHDQK
jgi:hypothetical protein